MRRLTIYVAIIGVGLGLFGSRIPAFAQAAGQTATYSAGLNLVSGPPGSDFSAVQGSLSTYQSGDRDYELAPASSGTVTGYGYWAQFAAPASLQLSAGSSTPYSARALTGQWVLVGDPSGTVPATVTGANALYVYDPTAGYTAATLLQPGQGAWARATGGGMITVTPQTPEMLAAAASLRTFKGNGYQIGVPSDWDRISTGSGPGAPDAEFDSYDGNSGLTTYVDQVPAGTPLNATRILDYRIENAPPEGFHLARVISPGAQVAVAGADTAAIATADHANDRGRTVTQTRLYAIRNETIYRAVFASAPEYAAQNQALIQQVAQSLQLMP